MPYPECLLYNAPVPSIIGCALDFSSMLLLFLATLLMVWPYVPLLFSLFSSTFFLLPVLFLLQDVLVLCYYAAREFSAEM